MFLLDCIELFLSMRDYLATRSFVADISLMRNFHSTYNFGIVKLNNKVLPSAEQLLNLTNQATKNFIFSKR